MFWSIVRCGTGLGLKTGALLGALYFPVFGLLVSPLLSLITTGHLPNMTYGDGTSGVVMIFLGLLIGAVSGTLLGVLNGLMAAVLLTRTPQSSPPQRPRRFAVACAAVNFCGLSLFLFLLFETDFFSNFSLSPESHSGPHHILSLTGEAPLFLLFVWMPALVAAAGAFWAAGRLMDWYEDETSVPQNAASRPDAAGSLDNLWPL